MIFIDRGRLDENGNPIAPDNLWIAKSNTATAKVKSNPAGHDFDRSVYAADIVRAALEKLFHRKCAYCERRLESFDVEHYRPKGRVAENKNHPGYYWLAYEWNNLLPSCSNCNQKRRDKPMWGDFIYGITGGKADQFPLKNRCKRAMNPENDITKEEPLLLNPSVDEPEEEFKYLTNGEITWKGDRGEVTISICSLYRRRLKDERKEVIDRIKEFILIIKELRENEQRLKADKFENCVKNSFLGDNCIFAGAARYVFNNFDQFPTDDVQ